MAFNRTEQFVLAMLAVGILQAGYKEGHISKSKYERYAEEACAKLGTSINITLSGLEVNPFLTIRQMDSRKKNFVKSFLFEVLQKVPDCETATYYVVSTLDQGGLITNI